MRGATYISRPCPQGHHGLRYLASGGCVECHRLHNERYKRTQDPKPRDEAEIRADLADLLTEQLLRQRDRWGIL